MHGLQRHVLLRAVRRSVLYCTVCLCAATPIPFEKNSPLTATRREITAHPITMGRIARLCRQKYYTTTQVAGGPPVVTSCWELSTARHASDVKSHFDHPTRNPTDFHFNRAPETNLNFKEPSVCLQPAVTYVDFSNMKPLFGADFRHVVPEQAHRSFRTPCPRRVEFGPISRAVCST